MSEDRTKSRNGIAGKAVVAFEDRAVEGDAPSASSFAGLDADELTRLARLQDCLVRLDKHCADATGGGPGQSGESDDDVALSAVDPGSTAQPRPGSTFVSAGNGERASGGCGTGDESAGNRVNSDLPDVVKKDTSGSSPGFAGRIGRFEIVGTLGRGGQGLMLLAYDPVLARRVALKVPWTETLLTPQLRRRFMREAQAVARLTHPHIVSVYDVGEVGPISFIASAFVEGQSLAAWLKKHGTAEPHWAARLVADLADAMHYAHSQGVLHRDLKPANVLLEARPGEIGVPQVADGERAAWVAKITDFGLAKILDLAGDDTRTGAIIGTPAYMSPEQARADYGEVGPATDIYALGAILYELLLGRPPFRARSDAETLRQVVADEPTPPRRSNPYVPRDLEAICLRCLEKAPARRYASAGELAADLRRFLAGEPTRARPLSSGQRVVRWVARNRRVAALLATVAALLVGVAAVSATAAFRINMARRAAEESAALAEHKARDERAARAEAERLRDESEQNLVKLSARESELREQAYVNEFHRSFDDYPSRRPLTAQQFLETPRFAPEESPEFEWQLLNDRVTNVTRSLSTGTTGEKVLAVVFTRDGRFIAAGTDKGKLLVWDAKTLAPVKSIQAHGVCLPQISLSPTEDMVATVSCDKLIKLWDTQTWECVGELAGHKIEVSACAFSPDGLLLATGTHCQQNSSGEPAELCLWDVPRQRCVALWHAAENKTMSLAFINGGQSLIAGFQTGNILEWDVTARAPATVSVSFPLTPPPRITDPSRPINNGVIASPDHRRVAYVSQGDGLDQWVIVDLNSPTPPVIVAGLFRNAVGAFSPDNRLLAAVSEHGNEVRLFSTTTGSPVATFHGHNDLVDALAFSPDGQTLAVARRHDTVSLYDTTPREVHHHFLAKNTVIVDAECRRAYFRSEIHHLEVRDLLTGELLQASDPVTGRLVWLAGLSADEEWACYVDESDVPPKLLLVDLTNQQNVRDLGPCLAAPAFTRDARLLAVVTPSGVCLRDPATGRVLREVALPGSASGEGPSRLEFSQDGRKLMILSDVRARCQLLDVATGSLSDFGPESGSARFSPDGRLAAKFKIDTNVEIVDARTGELIRTTTSPAEGVQDADFSPDGRTLAGACNDGALRLWRVSTGQELCTLAQFDGPLIGCRFARDGATLVAWSLPHSDGYIDVHVYRIPPVSPLP